MKLQKHCIVCNGVFYPKGDSKSDQYSFSRQKYCGHKCNQRNYDRVKRESRVVEVCDYCGGGSVGHLDLYDGKCSIKCARAAEKHMSDGGVCTKCGALWLGEVYCTSCGERLDSRAL